MNHRTYRDMRPHFRNFFPHRYNLRERYPMVVVVAVVVRVVLVALVLVMVAAVVIVDVVATMSSIALGMALGCLFSGCSVGGVLCVWGECWVGVECACGGCAVGVGWV